MAWLNPCPSDTEQRRVCSGESWGPRERTRSLAGGIGGCAHTNFLFSPLHSQCVMQLICWVCQKKEIQKEENFPTEIVSLSLLLSYSKPKQGSFRNKTDEVSHT